MKMKMRMRMNIIMKNIMKKKNTMKEETIPTITKMSQYIIIKIKPIIKS